MRKSALAGLFAFGIIFLVNGSRASASSLDTLKENIAPSSALSSSAVTLASIKPAEDTAPIAPVKPEPQTYEVKHGDTLSTIAADHQTTWVRLFNKNTQLASPDVLQPGDKITIPLADEQLADRPLPVAPMPTVTVATPAPVHTRTTPQRTVTTVTYARGGSSGNTYAPGYCTWYAKNRRPDLPNNLGNADTWVARAAAQGIPTGPTPRVGAIGQAGMHVVYVESVNGDGTVIISEMNYYGLYIVSSRTVPAGSFYYIY